MSGWPRIHDINRMKLAWVGLVAVGLLSLSGGCRSSLSRSSGLYQYSTLQALIEGVYDGNRSLAELGQHGDFGIGTFNGLDGEMILVDGTFYQVRADGKVYEPTLETRTPFAAVLSFESEQSWPVPEGLNYKAFKKWLDEKLDGDDNLPVAVHMRGTFVHVRTRSVPAQTHPYPRLTEVTKHQPVFDMKYVSGRLIGFRLPAYLAGVNVAGYHLHFLSDDLQTGGHLLDFNTTGGTVEICRRQQLVLDLPSSAAFRSADLADDKEADVHAVER